MRADHRQRRPSSDTDSPVAGGTLTYASGDAEPTCLDPHVGGNYPQALVGSQYLESLVSKDAKGEIIPWLAEKWKVSDDGLTWDFTLRDGVKFTDGTPLDAAAIAANIKHVQDPKTGSSTGYLALGKVADTKVVSDSDDPTHPEHPRTRRCSTRSASPGSPSSRPRRCSAPRKRTAPPRSAPVRSS